MKIQHKSTKFFPFIFTFLYKITKICCKAEKKEMLGLCDREIRHWPHSKQSPFAETTFTAAPMPPESSHGEQQTLREFAALTLLAYLTAPILSSFHSPASISCLHPHILHFESLEIYFESLEIYFPSFKINFQTFKIKTRPAFASKGYDIKKDKETKYLHVSVSLSISLFRH